MLAEQLSVGDLAAFSLYSLFVGGSATGLATAYGDLMQAAGAADRVFSLTQPIPLATPTASSLMLRPEVRKSDGEFARARACVCVCVCVCRTVPSASNNT